jgi:hypothetical protein
MEDVVIFYGHLVHFTANLYTLWPLDIFCGYLEYFPRFGKFHVKKYGNPDSDGWTFHS